LKLIDFNKEYLNLPEISSPLTIDPRNGKGLKNGLYDPNIFGESGSREYKKQFGQILLGTNIISPVILNILKTSNRKVYRICREN